MLFNSYTFIFAYLPVVLGGFFLLGRVKTVLAVAWLTLASLAFYGWWNPVYLLLLIGSIVGNFSFARAIGRLRVHAGATRAQRLGLLWLALGANLALLGYFKYAGFFAENLGRLLGAHFDVAAIVLPLGISFFTFTQIAFLVDTHKGEVGDYSLLQYTLFVSYFPHLLAGPIIHHRAVIPQLSQPETFRPNLQFIATGLTIFAMGLVKKVVLADGLAPYVGPAFEAARLGQPLTLLEAWSAALAFTLQIYFDFSGYSDMALGLSRMFGIHLPINFNSPLQAQNITSAWQRWHISFTHFLRDYLFLPLGGGRRSGGRRTFALFATMLLGGLWHGAAWSFVAFGALHAIYLFVHFNVRILMRDGKARDRDPPRWLQCVNWALTFTVWTVGAAFFRAADLTAAAGMVGGMAGLHGAVLPTLWQGKLGALGQVLSALGVHFGTLTAGESIKGFAWIAPALLITALAPNTQWIMRAQLSQYRKADFAPPPLGRSLSWRPSPAWAVAAGLVAALGLLNLTRLSAFLYYQF